MPSAQLYDAIGATYTGTRRTEPRIAARVWAALGDARTVVNVGAGTGSYEPPGRDVSSVDSWRAKAITGATPQPPTTPVSLADIRAEIARLSKIARSMLAVQEASKPARVAACGADAPSGLRDSPPHSRFFAPSKSL